MILFTLTLVRANLFRNILINFMNDKSERPQFWTRGQSMESGKLEESKRQEGEILAEVESYLITLLCRTNNREK
jgi:hypothetical protein